MDRSSSAANWVSVLSPWTRFMVAISSSMVVALYAILGYTSIAKINHNRSCEFSTNCAVKARLCCTHRIQSGNQCPEPEPGCRASPRPCYYLQRGGKQKMGTLTVVVQQLKRERESAQKQIQRIDAALAVLGSPSSNGTSHTMSAAARRRISLAQKARWAKQKAATPKRTISAAGRRRIAAAQRARWAKVKRAA